MLLRIKYLIVTILIILFLFSSIGCADTKYRDTSGEQEIFSDLNTTIEPPVSGASETEYETPSPQASIAPVDLLDEEGKRKLETFEFMESFDGWTCLIESYRFFKAYIYADFDTAACLLENPNDDGGWFPQPQEKRSFDDVTFVVTKGYEYAIQEGYEVFALIYEFGLMPNESGTVLGNRYLYITMIKIDEEWMVHSFCLDA